MKKDLKSANKFVFFFQPEFHWIDLAISGVSFASLLRPCIRKNIFAFRHDLRNVGIDCVIKAPTIYQFNHFVR